jgi:hypothetical protein
MGYVQMERKRSQQLKMIFLGEPQEGGVTLLGGRNKRGESKEWRGINEKKGVGSPWEVMWGLKGVINHERGAHLSHNVHDQGKTSIPLGGRNFWVKRRCKGLE